MNSNLNQNYNRAQSVLNVGLVQLNHPDGWLEGYNRFMEAANYYNSKGMTLLKITDDKETGRMTFLVKAPTRIPRVSRKAVA